MASKSITITGTIHALHEQKTLGASFTKREFVVLTDDPNPKFQQYLPIEFTGDKIVQLNGYAVGDAVSVEANLRGREWRSPAGEVKTFLSLAAWKIERTSAAQSRGGSHEPAPSSADNSDLPF